MVTGNFVLFLDSTIKIPFGAAGNVETMGLDDNAQKLYPFGKMLQIDFIGMKLQLQFIVQVIPDFWDEGFEVVFVLVDNYKIVHIAAIMPDAEGGFDEMVEWV